MTEKLTSKSFDKQNKLLIQGVKKSSEALFENSPKIHDLDLFLTFRQTEVVTLLLEQWLDTGFLHSTTFQYYLEQLSQFDSDKYTVLWDCMEEFLKKKSHDYHSFDELKKKHFAVVYETFQMKHAKAKDLHEIRTVIAHQQTTDPQFIPTLLPNILPNISKVHATIDKSGIPDTYRFAISTLNKKIGTHTVSLDDIIVQFCLVYEGEEALQELLLDHFDEHSEDTLKLILKIKNIHLFDQLVEKSGITPDSTLQQKYLISSHLDLRAEEAAYSLEKELLSPSHAQSLQIKNRSVIELIENSEIPNGLPQKDFFISLANRSRHGQRREARLCLLTGFPRDFGIIIDFLSAINESHCIKDFSKILEEEFTSIQHSESEPLESIEKSKEQFLLFTQKRTQIETTNILSGHLKNELLTLIDQAEGIKKITLFFKHALEHAHKSDFYQKMSQSSANTTLLEQFQKIQLPPHHVLATLIESVATFDPKLAELFIMQFYTTEQWQLQQSVYLLLKNRGNVSVTKPTPKNTSHRTYHKYSTAYTLLDEVIALKKEYSDRFLKERVEPIKSYFHSRISRLLSVLVSNILDTVLDTRDV